MSIDITTIGIEYDTSGLEKGTRAQDKTTESANKMGNAVQGVGNRFSGLAKTVAIAGAALAALGITAIAKQFIEIGDAVTLMDARLKLATGSTREFAQAQKDIYAISQANNVGLQETTTLYTKLFDPVKRLGGSTKEATAIVDAFATSLRVGGAGAQEAASATLQFAQAMGSGKLQGDEFRSMAEASPRFMKALAEGMGVPIEKLKEMGSEGKLTADVVGNALVKSLGKLKKEALSLPDTVGGAVTRFKNDIIVAVGEINNSEGFTAGFAGLIEGARQLIPTIKDELAGALAKINEWFKWINDEVIDVWNNAKGLLGQLWEIAKPVAEVSMLLAGWIVNTGIFSNSLVAIRILVAGVSDGFTIVGAALAGIGSKIMQFVLSPLTFVLEKSAQIAGVFNEDLANKIRGVNKNISDFTGAGSEYGSNVVAAFGRGETALGALNKSLAEGNTKTKEVTKSVNEAGGGYKVLAGHIDNTKKATKALSIEEEALHFARKTGTKLDLELAKEFDKSMDNFAKEQIKRTKEVTKEITDSILTQGKNYLSLTNKLDLYTDSLNDANDLAKLEMSLLGSSNSERETAIELYKVELTLKKQLKEINEANLDEGAKSLLESQAQTAANLARSQVELKVQQGEWSKFFGDIYTGLSDSLYRGFESGKGFFKSFWDGIKNLFKTTVLKLAVQGVMTGVLGLGVNGAATAQGLGASGGLGSVASTLSTGKTLWEGFSAASTIGGGFANILGAPIASLGTALGSSTLTAFASGLTGTVSGFGAVGSVAGAGINVGATLAGGSAGAATSAGAGVASALAAIPVWGWAALAGGALLSKFGGGGDRVTGAQNVSGTLGTNDISRNVDFTKSGGLFGKSDSGTWNYNLGTSAAIASNGRSYTDTASQASDSAMLSTINTTYAALLNAGKGFASILGVSADVVTSTTDKINFAIGKTQAETDAAMQAAFGQVADNIAKRIIPSIDLLMKEGESASQALERVAMGFSSANSVFADLGLKLFEMNDAGLSASSIFIELIGGLDGLKTASQSYYDNFYTQEEKNANILKSLTAEFEKQNLMLPASRDGYRSLVEEISKTGTPEQLASLLNMNEAFASVFQSVDAITNKIDIGTMFGYGGGSYINAERQIEASSIRATQALEDQAAATKVLAIEQERKVYLETADALLRAGKVAELMAANYSLNQINLSSFVSNGSFNAGGFNSKFIRQRAKLSIELANKASEDAINVEDITGVLTNLFSFTKDREFANELRRDLNLNSGFQNDIGYVMFDFIEASLNGARLKDFAARGQGVAGVLSANEDIGYQSELQSAYARSLNQANELLRLNIITQDEYTVSLNQANEMMKDQIVDIEKLNEAYRQAGIDSVAFYFNKIGDAVAKLNEEAAKASEPIALITSAIGRFTSISDVFGLSSKAAGTVGSNAELVSQSAAIAAQILTTQSAQAAAKVLAEKASFAGSSSTQLRDFSLLIEGVKKFDPQSLENGFLRISDALNKGIITQGQYTDLFNTSVGIFNGVNEETKLFESAMDNLRKSMGSFADSILVDSSKTTLSLTATREELMRQYDVAKIIASTGDTTGISQFQDVANQLLDVNKYASQAEYNVAFGKIYGDARNLETLGNTNRNNGENVVAQLKESDKKADERIARLEDSLLFALSSIIKNTDETVTEVRGLSIA